MWDILIVDDDPDMLKVCSSWLNRSPAVYNKVETASSADEAIKMLEEEKKVYDAVVTDLMMPSYEYLEGFEVIKKIKKNDPEFTHTKVIVFTVLGPAEPEKSISAIRQALQYGVSDYILKEWPNYLEVLDSTIQKELYKADISPIISPIKKGQVFIDSPYDKHHDVIFETLVSRALNSSFKFIRADDKFHGDYLKEWIYKQILESEFVIAFISGLNSNVMYELGLAQGMGKKVIIVKDDETEIVSDLKGIQYLCYERETPFNIFDKIFRALEDFTPELT